MVEFEEGDIGRRWKRDRTSWLSLWWLMMASWWLLMMDRGGDKGEAAVLELDNDGSWTLVQPRRREERGSDGIGLEVVGDDR